MKKKENWYRIFTNIHIIYRYENTNVDEQLEGPFLQSEVRILKAIWTSGGKFVREIEWRFRSFDLLQKTVQLFALLE